MTLEPLVLAVDDEVGILRLIRLELASVGFKVITAISAAEAREQLETFHPELILLDVIMPSESGIEFLVKLRETSNLPVIIVSARDRDVDITRGLDCGADDYVTKPFSPEVLAARIRAVLRRGRMNVSNAMIHGNLRVDFVSRKATVSGIYVKLSRTEWLLLANLAANYGRVLTYGEILSKVWGPEYRDDLRYLRTWIHHLRRKIESDPRNPKIIITHAGIGYEFVGEKEN